MGVEERDVKSFVDGKVAELIADKGLLADAIAANMVTILDLVI